MDSCKLLVASLLALGAVQATPALAAAPWSDVVSRATPTALPLLPTHYRLLQLEHNDMGSLLQGAPLQARGASSALQTPALELSLPLPGGGELRVAVLEASVMALSLAQQYPEIKTYRAVGVDDPSISGRLDLTPQGFHGMLDTPDGQLFIDPRETDDGTRFYISYYRHDYQPAEKLSAPFSCGVTEHFEPALASKSVAGTRAVVSAGTQLRNYRIAIAATGEYTSFHGGANGALAAINTTLNRVNQMFERDMSLSMTLVANNNAIIYSNASTDPYSNSSGGAMLGQNQANLDSVIGSANYDIGHVFSTGGGGIAALGRVCAPTAKGEGVTGGANPINDPFDIDFVAHEIGHQFGANHTFNGTSGNCVSPNRNNATAYEPGSGSTIMAYAGICGAENLQSNSDALFHIASIQEVVSFITTGLGNNCPTLSNTGNNAPESNAGSDVTIPANTYFELTGSGSDVNADALNYAWEQFDLGAASSSAASMVDNGDRPIFRSFPLKSTPTRSLPRLLNVLSNTSTLGEALPTTTRDLNFRLTVRDGKGGVATDGVLLSVTNAAGPFQITALNSAGNLTGGSTQLLTWNVANTSSPPISCATVDVLFSSDGGNTFATTLLSGTANDGNENITLPSVTTTLARLKLKCSDNVFFDVNDANFAISAAANTAPSAIDDAFSVAQNSSNSTLDVLANDTDSDAGDTREIISVTGFSAGGSATLSGTGINNTLRYTPANGFSGSETFSYTMRDGAGAQSSATVSVTVNAPANNPPSAVADSFSVAQNSSNSTLDVLANDTDSDAGDTREIISVTGFSAGGSATLSGAGVNNTLRYTPAGGFSGTETFSYTMRDGAGAQSSATVSVTVNAPANNPPSAVADSFSVTQNSSSNTLDVLANDTDSDAGDTREIISVTGFSAGGSAALSGAGVNNTLRYTPANGFSGTETFSYTMRDGAGAQSSATVSVTISSSINNAPSAVADNFSVTQDSSNNTLNVLINDTDLDVGDTREVVSVTGFSAGGSATLSGAGVNNTLRYTPAGGFSGTETFSYTMRDGAGAQSSATVSITVNAIPNDPPAAVNDSFTVAESSANHSFDVLSNDTDTDAGDSREIFSVGTPSAGGTVALSGTGVNNTLTYTPAAGFSGTETFGYVMRDRLLARSSAQVTVTVESSGGSGSFSLATLLGLLMLGGLRATRPRSVPSSRG